MMFKDLKKLANAAVNTVMLPVDIVLDVTCINPIVKDEMGSPQRIKRIVESLGEIGKQEKQSDE